MCPPQTVGTAEDPRDQFFYTDYRFYTRCCLSIADFFPLLVGKRRRRRTLYFTVS